MFEETIVFGSLAKLKIRIKEI